MDGWLPRKVVLKVEELAFVSHKGFSCTLIKQLKSVKQQHGLIVSGGSDKVMYVFDPQESEKELYTLIGHSENVCSIAEFGAGDVISGSWDKTAIIWSSFQAKHVLKGHEQAVWSVLCMRGNIALTGSADKTIKFWENGSCTKTLRGHQDAVRSLCAISDTEFISCSNDSTLRVWNLNGESIRELSAHTSFVYSVDSLRSIGSIVSCGEDRSVRVWDRNYCVQTILLPCASVWSLRILENGDIVCACSDGHLYIFTNDASRSASAEEIATFESQVSQFAISSKELKGINDKNVAGPEVLQRPGKKDEVVMVKVNNSIEAHQWDAAQSKWVKVGVVVDAIGSDRKQLYNGKEYDYVFDIEIQAGVLLKLPYNLADNPFQAAQDFIHAHELPQDFLEQIANFLIENTQGVNMAGAQSNADPFTGRQPDIPKAASHLKLSDSDIKEFEAIFGVRAGSAAIRLLNSGNVKASLRKVCFAWPESSRFPEIVSDIPDVYLQEKGLAPNILLALRCFANIFGTPEGKKFIFQGRDKIRAAISKVLTPSLLSNRQLAISVSTFFANFSVLCVENRDETFRVDLLEDLTNCLKASSDEESDYRCFVAIGTLLKTSEVAKEAFNLLGGDDVIKSRAGNTKLGPLLTELRSI
ncbi:hypothetical protein HDU97_002006 [Phlyctochytrium planicorne]|nr:hypothetical protein HDU97_002006 [Phlyctochytrium planicorne]